MDRTAGGYPAGPSAFGSRSGRLAWITRRDRRLGQSKLSIGQVNFGFSTSVALLKKERALGTGPGGRENARREAGFRIL